MSSRTEPQLGNWRWERAALVVLTALALVVRLPGLDGGLWVDEIFSIVEAFRSPFPQSLTEFPYDHKHPLYSVLAHASIVMFGEHAWSVRLPAVLFGVACVPMLYVLGTRITGRSEAFAASALIALSYHHIWFSQNARGYTMLAFWTIVGTVLLIDAIRGNARLWAAYGAVLGLGVYTHLTFIFIAAGQLLAVCIAVFRSAKTNEPQSWRGPFISFSVGAVFAFLLYAPMLGPLLEFFLKSESNLRGVSTPGWALSEGVRVLRLGFGVVGPVGVIAGLAAGAIGVAGIASLARRQPAVAMLLVLPAMTMFMGALVARGTMYPRFFFALIGTAIVIWMHGAFVAAGWIARRLGMSAGAGRRVGVATAGLVVAASAASIPLNWRAPKQDFAGALRFAESSVSGNEVIATADVTSLIYGPFFRRSWPSVRSAVHLDSLRAKSPVWLLYTFPRYLAVFDAGLAETVARECKSAARFRGTVGDGDVIVCKLGST